MNAVTNFILLAILTLVASRHVHAYRIARRRRTGDRTNRRTPTSNSFQIPQCDPTCCNPSICLKYLIQPQKLATDAHKEQAPVAPAPDLDDYLLPFDERTTAVRPYSLPGASPHRPSHNFPPLTKEEEFIVRTRHGRYFQRRDQLLPLQNEKMNYGHPLFRRTMSKRSEEERLCPITERWSDIEIAYNGHVHVQVVQLNDERQWFLEEQCQTSESPIVGNVQCVQKTRRVPALVAHRNNSVNSVEFSTMYIQIECCVAVRGS